MPLEAAIDNTQQIQVNASPNTGGASPKPAQIEGALVITVLSGNGTFTQDPATPLSFQAVSPDEPGVTVYDVAGDANLNPDIAAFIHDTFTLTVTSAVAAGFGFTLGPVTPKA